MQLIIYEGTVLTEEVITATISDLDKMVYDKCVMNLCELYNTFIELIKKQESSDCDEPGTECVLYNDLDTCIKYSIDGDYDIVIDEVVW